MLHNTSSERLANNEHSNLLGRFASYEGKKSFVNTVLKFHAQLNLVTHLDKLVSTKSFGKIGEYGNKTLSIPLLNKLECYITLAQKVLLMTNTLTYWANS